MQDITSTSSGLGTAARTSPVGSAGSLAALWAIEIQRSNSTMQRSFPPTRAVTSTRTTSFDLGVTEKSRHLVHQLRGNMCAPRAFGLPRATLVAC